MKDIKVTEVVIDGFKMHQKEKSVVIIYMSQGKEVRKVAYNINNPCASIFNEIKRHLVEDTIHNLNVEVLGESPISFREMNQHVRSVCAE